MATRKGELAKRPGPRAAPSASGHLVPVVVTTAGRLLAGKRDIETFWRTRDASVDQVAIHEFHHHGVLALLKVARDAEGKLHLATAAAAADQGWAIVA